jgi:hypothetical protein
MHLLHVVLLILSTKCNLALHHGHSEYSEMPRCMKKKRMRVYSLSLSLSLSTHLKMYAAITGIHHETMAYES